jgi:hypothetical protein
MLNFTMVNLESLPDMIKCLNDSFRDLTSNDKFCRDYFKRRFPAGLRSLEVVRGSDGWHAHLHCIALSPDFGSDFQFLMENWNRFVCNNLGVDSINKCGSVFIKGISGVSLISGVVETIKYIFKPNKDLFMNSNDLRVVFDSLYGKRQINCWGSLRGIGKQVDSDMDSTGSFCSLCDCNDFEVFELFV